ncbi:hypothetical protein [Streptomyces sp. NBC_01546]|uniref:hypothetical protein n=1 Tax=Streptomyces sp. NBC_01546 TaxID=2975872 RepID=UPI00386FCF17
MRLLPSTPVTFLIVSPAGSDASGTPEAAPEAALAADAVVLDLREVEGAPARMPDVAVLPGRQCWALIAPPRSAEGEAELRRLSGAVDGLMVTCVGGTDDLDRVAALGPGTPLIPVIDSAEALRRAPSLARHPAVVRLGFTSRHACPDFTDGMLSVQSTAAWVYRIVAAASAAADLPGPVGGICPGPQDRVAVAGEAAQTADAGFTGYCVSQPEFLADAAAAIAAAAIAAAAVASTRRVGTGRRHLRRVPAHVGTAAAT